MDTSMIRRTEQEIGRDTPPIEAVDDLRRTRRPIVAATSAVQPVRRTAPLRSTLGSRHTLRQAMLLNEILGPPAALRRPQDKHVS